MVDASLIKKTTNEQTIEQIIKEKRDKISFYLHNAEDDQETRAVKQQEAYRLEKQWKDEDQDKNDKANPNNLDNIIERFVIQNRVDILTKPFSEKIKGACVNTVNNTNIGQKAGERKQVIGKLIDLTLVEEGELCVIDFDFNKNLSKEKIDDIRQNIIDNMLPANVRLVKTFHSGLHVYCNKNGYRLPNNRCMKCIVLDNIEIDIFAQIYEHKSIEDDPMQTDLVQNRVVGPKTSIRETKNGIRETLKYETINDCASMTHLVNQREILESWNVDIEIQYMEFEKLKIARAVDQQITNYGTIDKMDGELAQACVDGMKNFTIHNYPLPIAMEVSLLSLFSGISGIVNEQVRAQRLENIRKFNIITPNAEKNYDQAFCQGEHKPNKKAASGETEDVYMIKEFNTICGTLVHHHKFDGTIYKQLEKVNLNFKKKKTDEKNDETKESTLSIQLTAKHIFKKYASKFVIKGCKFISDDPEIFSIFQGCKYKQLDIFDQGYLKMYLVLIKETIAAGEEKVYEYILNWITWMIQTPGKKSRAAIILQGRQGKNKNRFTDVNAELTNRYCCRNITNTDEFTGDFNSVVENQIFALLNEMRNYNDSKKGIVTVTKSIISDESIRIIEKNQSIRTAENVISIIYISNADSAVQLGIDDRRHQLCACRTVYQLTEEHKEDIEYFTQLSQSYTQVSYENLMTFFLERDISQFNPTLIPITEAKKQLINICHSPIDDAIIEHYQQFKQGIPIALKNQCKPQNWRQTIYKNAMQHKRTEQLPRINGKRSRVYVLNIDQQTYYDKMMNEEDIEASNKYYQKYKKSIEDDGFVDQVVQDVAQDTKQE
ncbi:MAG: hypothetical protein EZS28_009761 [Streblomastix strix]|uniref:NrS-1 polymerase-like helicase domain-containing protein n=1 Tax=Streblomastix strix TaxID=222440 RepID=A0A5J4WJ13_9EUKA|nr:MAG: hypothetical protein EZS28_009761 [Streblomastix strix]